MDTLVFGLGHSKLTIKSHNKSTGTYYTTKIMDPHHLCHTREQKHGSKAWILRDLQGFGLGHSKLTIKSQNKSTGTDHNTIITDPHDRGYTREQKHGYKARILTDP